MARAHAIADAGRWSADATPVRVEYALAVLERIRAEAVEGFCRFPRGGVEVGGVLFGNIDGDLIRILDGRPVPSEYAFGPSYTLSEKDQAVLRGILEAARTDPELTGMVPVGWYHSHTRSEVLLSMQDCGVHDRYFPGRRQVALVVKPEPFGSARAGFFVREPDGSMHTESTYQEFVIPVPSRPRKVSPEEAAQAFPRREPAQPEAEQRPEPVPVGTAAEARSAAYPALAPRLPDLNEPLDAEPPSKLWLWAAGIAALLAVGVVFVAPNLHRTPAARPSLGLRVVDSDGSLRISWRRDILPLTEAQHASLQILDGGEHVSVPFDPVLLYQGTLEYPRRSDNVEVKLRVERPEGEQEESVHFLGSPIATVPPLELPVNKPARPFPAPSPGSTGQASASQVLPPPAPTVAANQPRPREFDMSGVPAVKRPEQEVALPAPPEVEASGARALPTDSGPAPTVTVPRTAPPPPPPQPAPGSGPALLTRPPAGASVAATPASTRLPYSGPSSGRIIWTGDLVRGTSLSLSGHQASAGVVSGEFPGVPVRISVHPADLSARGLTVYSTSGRSGREAPGPQNGWNATAYAQDARRAGELLVLESPSAQNGWKKIVVRNDSRDVSVIVIDWKTAE